MPDNFFTPSLNIVPPIRLFGKNKDCLLILRLFDPVKSRILFAKSLAKNPQRALVF